MNIPCGIAGHDHNTYAEAAAAHGRLNPAEAGQLRAELASCRDLRERATTPTASGEWRTIAADGTVGDPVTDDTPDYDEGETGPPQVDR